jgi:DNA-binding NtrC family response regulator
MKAFQRCVAGKSILVLTDRADVRKSIKQALMSATSAEVDLCFVRTSTELLKRMQDPREAYKAFIFDLSKADLQADNLVKCCREHGRYGSSPIVVLSEERELSELVRTKCSYAVFFPLLVSMLRESLLWCFDQKSLMSRSQRKLIAEQDSAKLALTAAAEDAADEEHLSVLSISAVTAFPPPVVVL